MFVPKVHKPIKVASNVKRTDRDEALEVLYPASRDPGLGITGAAYQLAQKFISNLRKDTINHDVFDLISRDGDAFLDQYRKKTESKSVEQSSRQTSMQAIVDKAFGVIEPYIGELNHSLASTELRVACTSPEWVTENLRNSSTSDRKSFYRARISTSRLSIVIRGSEGRIEFFVLPASMVMGLSKVEDRHSPLMCFEVVNPGISPEWEVEGKPLTNERMERYCLLMFNYLLEETKFELGS